MHKPQTSAPFVVLGAPRSGTSLLAGWLHRAGVSMGTHFLKADMDNPDGYFEDLDFLDFHRGLLARTGKEVGRVLEDSTLREVPFFSGLTEGDCECAQKLIRDRCELGKPWGWKDPRTCYFLSAWNELLPWANYLVIYRHPLEVGASLLRMGKNWDCLFDSLLPLRSWTFSMQEVSRFLEQLPCERFLLFGAESMWASPEDLAKKLSERWELPVSVSSLLQIRRSKSGPRHHGVSRRQHAVFARYFPEAAKAFDALQEQTAAPVSMSEAHLKPDPILDFLESYEVAPEFAIQLLYDSIQPAFRRLHHESRQGMALSAKAYIGERFRVGEATQAAYDQQTAYVQDLLQGLEASHREGEATQAAYDQQTAYAQDLLQALEATQKEFMALLEHCKKQKEQIDHLILDSRETGKSGY